MSIYSGPANSLFTIGHSNLEIDDFLVVLAAHSVQTLCDVRSRPTSFRFPQFNHEPLENALASAGIRYEFFGATLGGRPADPRVYREDGLVDYAARRRAPDFIEGLERAVALSRASIAALMCAGEDPHSRPADPTSGLETGSDEWAVPSGEIRNSGGLHTPHPGWFLAKSAESLENKRLEFSVRAKECATV
jgi:hypothetical protein